MSARQQPCEWELRDDLCRSGPCCPGADEFDPAIKAFADSVASELIWRLTGMQFGCCEITVRPCKGETCEQTPLADLIYWDRNRGTLDNMGVGALAFTPTLIDGSPYNIACGCPFGCCTCRADCEVWLPRPVCEVVSVQENGNTLDPDQYFLLDHHKLVLKYRWAPSTLGGQHTSIVSDDNPIVVDPADRWTVTVAPASVGANTIDYGNGVIGSQGNPNQNISFIMPTPLPAAGYTVAFQQNGDPGSTYGFANAPFFSNMFTSYQYPTDVFPIGSTLVAGDTITSFENSNTTPPTRSRFTVISGEFTRGSLQGWDISDDAEYLIEFEQREESCFPCQNYNRELGEDGTWGITYKIGTPVPDSVIFAASIYACEIGRSLTGDKNCRLPGRVQQVARQGVQVGFLDPTVLANQGLTGIPEIDSIIRAVNPYRLAERAYVWSPDLPIARRET